MGAVLLACRWGQRHQIAARFLLWLAAGYVLHALALGAQSLMTNAQLGQWTLITAIPYLMGSWCLAQGVVQRHGQEHASRWLGVVLSITTLALLYYFSRVHDDLRMRVLWLNMGMGLLQLLAIRSLLRAPPARDWLEKALRWTYVAFSSYIVLRALLVWQIVPSGEVVQLTRSGFWLLTLASSMLFTLWFSLLLLSCAVRDVFTTLKEERNQDPLTRLLNRRAFMETAEAVLTDRRTGPWAVVVADIDHFKQVNDNWGHDCGDQVLQVVSQLLVQQVRTGDAVARFGGEEFVILLQRVSLAEAEQVAQRIGHALHHAEMACLPQGRTVSLSFGIAPVADLHGLTAALSGADDLLYQAKQAGRDCVRVAQAGPLTPPLLAGNP